MLLTLWAIQTSHPLPTQMGNRGGAPPWLRKIDHPLEKHRQVVRGYEILIRYRHPGLLFPGQSRSQERFENLLWPKAQLMLGKETLKANIWPSTLMPLFLRPGVVHQRCAHREAESTDLGACLPGSGLCSATYELGTLGKLLNLSVSFSHYSQG